MNELYLNFLTEKKKTVLLFVFIFYSKVERWFWSKKSLKWKLTWLDSSTFCQKLFEFTMNFATFSLSLDILFNEWSYRQVSTIIMSETFFLRQKLQERTEKILLLLFFLLVKILVGGVRSSCPIGVFFCPIVVFFLKGFTTVFEKKILKKYFFHFVFFFSFFFFFIFFQL